MTAAVSSESELLILVDEDDREIGYRSKGECHDGEGLLHRAGISGSRCFPADRYRGGRQRLSAAADAR